MKSRSNGVKFVVIAIIFICIAAATTFIYMKFLRPEKKTDTATEQTVSSEEVSKVDEANHPYIDEVNYQGPIEYMELYDYPFSKSDLHIKNKDLVTGTKEASDYAAEFVKEFLTNDYRELSGNPQKIGETIEKYSDPDGVFFTDVFLENDAETVAELAEAMTDMYINDTLSTEAEFITNQSMVYQDLYLFCRGMIKIRYHGSSADAGKVRCIPAEVLMKQDTDGFTAVGIVPIEGYEEFEEEINGK